MTGETTIERLLDAALVVFGLHGFEGASVDEIAKNADVGVKTLYRLFESKAELFNRAYRRERATLDNDLGSSLAPGVPGSEQFQRLWRAMVSEARAHRVRLLFLEGHFHLPFLDEESRNVPTVPEAVEVAVRYVIESLGKPAEPAKAIAAFMWGGFVNLLKCSWHRSLPFDGPTLDAAGSATWHALSASPSSGPLPGVGNGELLEKLRWIDERLRGAEAT